jgi:chloride channel protein, CIC family
VSRDGPASGLVMRTRFIAGLGCVALGAAIFAVAFRAALALVYRSLFHADDVVAAITGLSPWQRVGVLMVGAAVAGVIARLRSAPTQGVSNVMEAVALGNVRLSMRTTLSRVLALYNTPFAAVIFVLETIVGVAALEALLPVMTASAVATLVTRATVVVVAMRPLTVTVPAQRCGGRAVRRTQGNSQIAPARTCLRLLF